MTDPLYLILHKLQQELALKEREIAHHRYGNDIYSIARSQGSLDGIEYAITLIKNHLDSLDE